MRTCGYVWTTWRSAVTPINASTLHILKIEIDPKLLPVVGSLVVSIFVRDTLDPGSTPPRRIIEGLPGVLGNKGTLAK